MIHTPLTREQTIVRLWHALTVLTDELVDDTFIANTMSWDDQSFDEAVAALEEGIDQMSGIGYDEADAD